MIKELKYKFAVVCFALCFAQFNFAADTVRLESEYKLDVPADISSKIWGYLQSSFQTGSSILESLERHLSATNSVEQFKDIYFDNSNLEFLKNNHGLRLRKRFYPNRTNHPSQGKELVQVKLSDFDSKLITRSEVKYKANTQHEADSFYGKHPLLKNLAKNDQSNIVRFLKNLNYTAIDFYPAISIDQIRSRIYINKRDISYATITFDEVTGIFQSQEIKYFEMELELNEILYTKASPGERKKMDDFNHKLKVILFKKFPTLVQDQTPKYNKAIKIFEQNKTSFQTQLIDHIEQQENRKMNNTWLLIFLAIILLIGSIIFVKRFKF